MSDAKSKRVVPRPLPRVDRFEKLGYGLFLHWGLYSQLGQGEWIQHQQKIPVKEYSRLFERFDAADFDAPAIARLAKDAGMRYAVLTTRHHEGFPFTIQKAYPSSMPSTPRRGGIWWRSL